MTSFLKGKKKIQIQVKWRLKLSKSCL